MKTPGADTPDDWSKYGRLFDDFDRAFMGDFHALSRLFNQLMPAITGVVRLSRFLGIAGGDQPDSNVWEATSDLCFRLIDEFPDAPIKSFPQMIEWVASRAIAKDGTETASPVFVPSLDESRLRDALGRLDARYRRVLESKLLAGKEFAAIGEELKQEAAGAGRSVAEGDWNGAARILFCRGLVALITDLEGSADGP